MNDLALIAGRGTLPGHIVRQLPSRPVVVGVEGELPDALKVDLTFRLETLGSFVNRLKERGVKRLCFAGRTGRPELDLKALDAETMALLPRVAHALRQGDDAAFRLLLGFFEEAGIRIVGAHELAPDLLPAPGVLAGSVTDTHRKDAARGAAIVAALGAADVGQACVVSGGQALALEALPGTDWMLSSLMQAAPADAPGLTDPLGMAADWLSGPAASAPPRAIRDPALPKGGLLFKGPKPRQDLRIDMPTIGPDTVRRAAKAGLEGIVIQAGAVMLLDLAEARAEAEASGLFLWVREADAP
ncbi:MAG: UDP-2,3-diacylglucosamine diphosphatase LpxI [Pseudomonadota bacterium]